MSGLLGSFVFRLSTDSFDLPTNEISWTAGGNGRGNDHIDVTFAFRPEVSATIDEKPDGLDILVWADGVPMDEPGEEPREPRGGDNKGHKEYAFHLGTDPSHDEVVDTVGYIFTAALNLHRAFKKDSWLDEV
jgi:hypothetical protein